MKTLKKIIVILILSFGSLSIYAQQDPMFTHYMYNTLMVNPAYAGSRDALTITALHRSQWTGFKGAPLTQTLTMHAPLRNEHIGLGLSVSNDKIGPTNNTSVIADFAYIMQLSKRSRLALGLSAGANIFQASLSTLQLDQQNDPVFLNNINNHTTPNFGFGVYYSRERFYAGISIPYLLENNYSEINQANGNTLIANQQRHYFFIMGTLINLSDNFAFKPTTLIKVTAAAPAQIDFTASFVIMKKFTIGAMIRSGDAVGGLVGLDITDQLHLGYSYDWSYGLETSRYNGGSHEIVLRYDFVFPSKKQIHSPRNF
ncbi:MAG: type IX secretion system membrane protein PorP/SprF [Bacteroidales bacterium]